MRQNLNDSSSTKKQTKVENHSNLRTVFEKIITTGKLWQVHKSIINKADIRIPGK